MHNELHITRMPRCLRLERIKSRNNVSVVVCYFCDCVCCSADGAAVQGTLAVSQILAVVIGRKTEVFRRYPHDAAEDDNTRSADFSSSANSSSSSSSNGAASSAAATANGGGDDDCDRRCLSLLSADRTLDLRAATPAVRAAWDRDLHALLDAYRRSR